MSWLLKDVKKEEKKKKMMTTTKNDDRTENWIKAQDQLS